MALLHLVAPEPAAAAALARPQGLAAGCPGDQPAQRFCHRKFTAHPRCAAGHWRCRPCNERCEVLGVCARAGTAPDGVGWVLFTDCRSRVRLQVQARHAATELAMSRAQLSLLSAAFQPHFLMNAMNALIACRHDPDAVESAGEGLAGYLRYTLDRSESEWEPLGAQLEALSNYLSVEELRFSSRLHTRVNSDPHLLQQVVPRFLLQPLVENAIKHGAINGYGTMQLLISLEQESGRLQLQVSNNGEIAPAASHNPGVGYGLSSLRQRLQLHYGDQAELSLMQQGAWVVATILLPLR